MMQGQTGDGARRAALVVHALPLDDRHWLMQQLPAPQRQVVEPLLQELQTIGIPGDPAVLQDIKAAPADGGAERDAQSDSLRRLLAAEPLRLTGVVLSLRDWPSAARFAAGLDPERRAAALLEAADAPPTRLLREALVRALEQAMGEQLAAAKGPTQPPWRRILEFVRRRFA